MKKSIVLFFMFISTLAIAQKNVKIPDFQKSIPFDVNMILNKNLIVDCENSQDVFFDPIVGYQQCCDGEVATINCYYQKDENSPLIQIFKLENVIRKNFRSPAFHHGIYWYTFETEVCHTTVKMIWKCSQVNFPFLYNQCLN